jgi:hypothetical protein
LVDAGESSRNVAGEHDMIKRILFAALSALSGALLIQFNRPSSPWQTVGGAVLVIAVAGLIVFARDAIQLGLQRLGIHWSSFRIQSHLTAGLLCVFLFALTATGPRPPHGADRAVIVLGPPLMLYLYRLFWIVVGYLVTAAGASGREKGADHK